MCYLCMDKTDKSESINSNLYESCAILVTIDLILLITNNF
jgi:hypothetical protein